MPGTLSHASAALVADSLDSADVLSLTSVARVDAIARREFLAGFRGPRRPVVIEQLTDAWPARATWSVDHLGRIAGEREVPVYDSRPARGRRHQHAPAARMRLADYVARLRAGERDLRIFFLRVVAELPELVPDFDYPDLGLRFFDKLSVLFVGGRGSRVQMHFDIDRADILLCHFGGRKRVVLFPPEETPRLYRVPFSFSTLYDVDFDVPDFGRFPALRHVHGELAELRHGDALYIPPGWWHYVVYDEIGLSISLRALPQAPRDLVAACYNVAVLRTVDGLMRRVVGEPWNRWNARAAVRRTHAALGLGCPR